jgi:hypothetical protein
MKIPEARIRHDVVAGAMIALMLGAASPCESQTAATYITQAGVDAVASQLSAIYTDDEPVRVIDAGAYHVGVFVVGRPNKRAAQPASADGTMEVTEGLVLPNVTAIVRIMKGSGAFVTGGKLVDCKPIASDDPDLAVIGPGFRSKRILGGENQHVKEGDVVIVPAGTPHGFSAIDEPLVYEVIRIDGAKTLPLK